MQEIISPSWPIWVVVLIGWKVFPEPVPLRNKKTINRRSPVSDINEFEEEMVPLGPMSGHERLKTRRDKKKKLLTDIRQSSGVQSV